MARSLVAGAADDSAGLLSLGRLVSMSAYEQLVDEARKERVAQAVGAWAQELIDLGKRNPLLYYRDLKTGTLDISAAPGEVMERLFSGSQVRLSEMVGAAGGNGNSNEMTRIVRSAAALAKRILVLDEEQGIDAGRVAVGLVDVTRPEMGSRMTSSLFPLRAPLLLWGMKLQPMGASQANYTLRISNDECEPNPVLLYALEREGGPNRAVLGAKLADLVGAADVAVPPLELAQRCLELIESEAEDAGFEFDLQRRIVVGTFSFEKMPMVDDLTDHVDLLAASDMVAALANDLDAVRAVAAGQGASLPRPDDIPPHEEYLIHDADSSQQAAIEAVLAGRHIVIDGPPGTGKSQTIANLIACLAARRRRVLFVAEKRAAIEAVTDGLARAGLDRLVFDLHEKKLDRCRLAQRLQQDLERASAEGLPDVGQLPQRLSAHRDRVREYDRELYRLREPWGVRAYDVQKEILGLPEVAQTRVRLPERVLARIDVDQRDRIESMVRDLVAGGGLRFLAGNSSWSGSQIRDLGEARAVGEHLDELASGVLESTWRKLDALLAAAGLRRPERFGEWDGLLGLVAEVSATVRGLGPEAFGPDLDDLVWATGGGAWRQADRRGLGFWARRRLIRRARSLPLSGLTDRRTVHARLWTAAEQRTRWAAFALDGSGPSTVSRLKEAMFEEAMAGFTQASHRLAAVAACAAVTDLQARSREEIDAWLTTLERARGELALVPHWNALVDELRGYGLDAFLTELVASLPDAETAALRWRRVWLWSVLEQMRFQSQALRDFNGQRHTQIVEAFRREDREHLSLNAARVRRRVAVRLKETRDTHTDQDRLIREQAARRSRHLATRRLVARAPDILFSLYPCWAMSPLVVSSLLPPEKLFDVVIFDEASQIEPENAIPAIMLASQVVVAGDDRQLPPTDFFRKLRRGEELAEDDDGSSLRDYESLLKRVEGLLGSDQRYRLRWHYRSKDERLISFSNVEIYGGELVTFPSASVESPVRLEVVDGVATPGQDGSAREEVDRVVELVLERAAQCTAKLDGETLGVITMGWKHAERVEAALKKARANRPDLAPFFSSEDRNVGQRFFVKSIEQVQGDERDHIILSIGYARTPSGRAPSNFGPLSWQHGERRLNVAVTRARKSMTVVSSFRHTEMDVSRATYAGPVLLRKFLEFAERGGNADALSGPTQDVELNPFEEQVLAALRTAGIPVQPQWGVGGYRIDFALGHRDRPGEFVLAVETDGRTYHSSKSARDRDRLRQEHLERLGWRFRRVWSTSWFQNRETERDIIVTQWVQACCEADANQTPRGIRNPPPGDRSDALGTEPNRSGGRRTEHPLAGGGHHRTIGGQFRGGTSDVPRVPSSRIRGRQAKLGSGPDRGQPDP